MEGENKELTYTEVAKAIRPDTKGPINKTLVENRLTTIKQQKYQYYEGHSNVIGSPYKPNGARNPNFTSPNFLSNSVFYEKIPSLGLSKNDMYKTTTNLLHSSSFEKLKIAKEREERGVIVRK